MTPFWKQSLDVYRLSLLYLVFFELISLAGFLLPSFGAAAFFIVLALAAAFAVIRFELAFLMLLAELFIGSQGGYLLVFDAGGIGISLRLGLFLVVFGAWAARSAVGLLRRDAESRRRALGWYYVLRDGKLLLPYAALLAVCALGLIRGLASGNDFGDVFFDGNGYAFFGLFPVFVAALADAGTRRNLTAVLLAAVTASVLKALFVFFVFSHRMLFVARYVYVWVRDTRVGEITRMAGDFYRVFFQSHLFALMAVLVILFLASYRSSLRSKRAAGALFSGLLALVGLVMGLSRSFWFGAFAGLAAMAAILYWGKAGSKVWKRAAGLGLAGFLLSASVIAGIYAFPFPQKSASVSLAALLSERAFSLSGEAAATSRWALLPELTEAGLRHPFLGSGLGTVVTYKTSDPRLLADNPTGEYATFAFEWGYHDLWVKFGLLGLLVYGWFVLAALRPAIAAVGAGRSHFRSRDLGFDGGQKEKAVLAAGFLAAAAALLATNVFSPYLNHPLGIGALMIAAAYGAHGAFSDSRTLPMTSR